MKKIDDQILLKMIEEGIPQNDIAAHFGVTPGAITHAKNKIIAAMNVPESFKSLTNKEQAFVLARAEGKTQTQAALASYECGSMDSAKNIGYQLGRRTDIQKAISELMEEERIGRRHRIKRLRDHIDNMTDRQASLKGIDIANRMEGIYIEKQVTMSVDYGELLETHADLVARKRQLMDELGITEKDIEGEGKKHPICQSSAGRSKTPKTLYG
ncbi:MAG: hypothetical protein C4576_25510 [Desulfobacteraceae bacterium]|nr:MAG: hypothetical protein C4576_25510 [Desulfobacteraceae bacterium]